MKNKKLKLLTLSAVLLLAGGAFVANNYNSHNETRVVEAAEKINIAENTRLEAAGGHIYFADKPAISIDDISVSIVSWEGVNSWAINNGTNKVHYVANEGWFLFTFGASASEKGTTIVLNISYVVNNVTYESDLKFVDGVYTVEESEEESDVTSTAINYQYDDDNEPTAIRFMGTVKNVDIDSIDKAQFVLALDGEERTIDVYTLYTSISGIDGFGEKENTYYAVYILKGLDAVDDEGNYKYRDHQFSADFKVTLKDETVVTTKDAISFTLAPVIVAEQLSTVVGALVINNPAIGYYVAFAPNGNASSYYIQIFDSNETIVAEQTITNGGYIDSKGLDVGTYTVKIKAVGDGVNYTDSEYVVAGTFEVESFVLANQLSKPVGVVRNPVAEGYICAFAAVSNASGYHLQVYDSTGAVVAEQDVLNGGLITCTDGLVAGTYTLKVKAVGDGVNYVDSEYSDPLTFTLE